MNESLTKRQKQILQLMSDVAPPDWTLFFGGTRNFRAYRSVAGDMVIQAYQTPEWFLERRGLIEAVQSNRGKGYRITERGRRAVARLKGNYRNYVSVRYQTR